MKLSSTLIFAVTLAVWGLGGASAHAATIDLDLTTTNPGNITLGSGDNVFSFDSFSVQYLIVGGGGGGGGGTTQCK
jgi:hypothetical protein